MFLDPFTKGHPANFFTRLGRYFYNSRKQESAGCVVYNKNRILLIRRGSFYNDWTFPKGKIENNCDPKSEALRETYEEVGLKPTIIAPLPANDYCFYVDEEKIKIYTKVHYFLAESSSTQIKLQNNPDKKEAASFETTQWFNIDEATNKVQHAKEKFILRSAATILGKTLS